MGYPKHEDKGAGKGKKKEPKAAVLAPVPAPVDHKADYIEANDRHSRCMEEAMDRLRSVVSTFVTSTERRQRLGAVLKPKQLPSESCH